jgi:outer membrane lipoprotein carrier protein
MHILKYKLIAITLLVCCSVVSAQRKALSPAETTAFKERVSANTQNLQSLESDFVQTKQLSYLENTIKSTGKLYFKAPGKIRWEYDSPTKYVIIFDDQTMYTEDGTTKKTLNLAANRRLKGLNDLLVGTVQGGSILDENRFTITCYRENADYSVVLVPREKALGKYVKQVELSFNGSDLLLKQVAIVDPSEDRTQLTFTNQLKNIAIADGKFTATAVNRK